MRVAEAENELGSDGDIVSRKASTDKKLRRTESTSGLLVKGTLLPWFTINKSVLLGSHGCEKPGNILQYSMKIQ